MILPKLKESFIHTIYSYNLFIQRMKIILTLEFLDSPYFSLGMIGRFTTPLDKDKYNLPVDTPWWLPTSDDPAPWFDTMLPALKDNLLED